MATTYAELLELAKTALGEILSGSTASYDVGGMRFTYHDLDTLRRHITWLEGKAATESGAQAQTYLGDISGRPG